MEKGAMVFGQNGTAENQITQRTGERRVKGEDRRPRSNQVKISAIDFQDLLERVRALEREIGHLTVRLETVEAAEARIETEVEVKQIEAEVGPIKTAAAARQVEADVKAAAARLEATTPHYPRA